MILLAIDTSGPAAGTAIIQDGAVRYAAMVKNRLTHSESMMPMVEEALRRGGMELENVDLFAVTVGPGSFTGVRLGVTAVKAFAHATGKNCVAVDALEATAYGASCFDGILCPIQDARAGQVYGALFEGFSMNRLTEDEPIRIEDYCALALDKSAGRRMLFLGDGTLAYREKILALLGQTSRALFAPPQLNDLRPAAVGTLAWQNRERAVDYLTLAPMYLRPPQAVRQKNLVNAEKSHE